MDFLVNLFQDRPVMAFRYIVGLIIIVVPIVSALIKGTKKDSNEDN